MSNRQSRQCRMEELFAAGLKQVEKIEIINQSHKHKHHAGDDGSGETHYDIVIIADDFEGQNRVKRQRLVNSLLAPEFETGLHAISMTLKTKAEIA